jgi:hypothetical protein
MAGVAGDRGAARVRPCGSPARDSSRAGTGLDPAEAVTRCLLCPRASSYVPQGFERQARE